jgi:hypothetical protein
MQQLRELRLAAAALENRLNTAPSDSLRANLFQAKRKIDQFRQSLHLPPLRASESDAVSLSQIQHWLPDSSILVEYFLGEQVFVCFFNLQNRF